MTRSTHFTMPPLASVLLAIVSVQAGAAIAKGLFPIVGPATTSALRVGLAAIMLLAAFRTPILRLTGEQWRAVLPYGIALGAMNVLFYLAIARIPLGLGVALEFVGPLGVAVASSRRAIDVVWVALAAVGIALIAPWSGSTIDPLGVFFALLTGAGWATYIVFGRRVSQLMSGGAAVATGMLIASVIVLPVAVVSGGVWTLSPRLWALAVGLAILSSALPFTLEMHALGRMPARAFSILMSLEPAVAALVGLVFLHEMLTVPQWTAIALVIAASAGSTATTAAPHAS
jgi:inner membrane transporter RhtA